MTARLFGSEEGYEGRKVAAVLRGCDVCRRAFRCHGGPAFLAGVVHEAVPFGRSRATCFDCLMKSAVSLHFPEVDPCVAKD